MAQRPVLRRARCLAELTGRRALVTGSSRGIGLACAPALQEHQPRGPPAVSAEDRQGSRRICSHLIARGHERIAFIAATHHRSAIEERIAGYRQAHEEADLELDEALVAWEGEFNPLLAANAAANVLERDPRPTAVMAANDLIALRVMRAARERGLRLAQDVAVTGFDDLEFAAAIDPPLTAARTPGYENGPYAAQMLVDALIAEFSRKAGCLQPRCCCVDPPERRPQIRRSCDGRFGAGITLNSGGTWRLTLVAP